MCFDDFHLLLGGQMLDWNTFQPAVTDSGNRPGDVRIGHRVTSCFWGAVWALNTTCGQFGFGIGVAETGVGAMKNKTEWGHGFLFKF